MRREIIREGRWTKLKLNEERSLTTSNLFKNSERKIYIRKLQYLKGATWRKRNSVFETIKHKSKIKTSFIKYWREHKK